MNIMAEENVMAEVMDLLEAEPAAALPAPGPDIPANREKLANLVCNGNCKETIGVNLTHEQVRRLEDKDVMKYYKRYETYVGANTSKTMIDNFLCLATKAMWWGLMIWKLFEMRLKTTSSSKMSCPIFMATLR